MFDSVNFITCYWEICNCNGVTFIGTQCS